MNEPIPTDTGPIPNPFQPYPDPLPDEQDACRVCRVEGDEEEPLIWPCKCSGSVRFVHPTCLNSWLAASGKRFCEICGHKYTFTKVYPEHIPSVIPLSVYLRQTMRGVSRLSSYAIRFWACIIGWLVVLPSLNMITLRSLVWSADLIARPEPFATNFTLSANSSAPLLHRIDFSLKHWYSAEDNTLPGFVFRGQILSITVAGVILGLVLVREWIQQHNWTENLHPETDPEDINPNDWMVRRGIAVKLSDLFKDPPSQALTTVIASEATTTDGAKEEIGNTSTSSGSSGDAETPRKSQTAVAADTNDLPAVPTPDGVPVEEDDSDEYEDEVEEAPTIRPTGADPARVAYLAPELLENLANELRQQNAQEPIMDAQQLEDVMRRMELHMRPEPPADAPAPAQLGRRHAQREVLDEWAEPLDEADFGREDWDGILEVIGLIGPWQNLFQNVIFAIIIMGGALTILVGIPIIMGKLWLTLNMAQTTYRGMRTLLRLARIFVDPVVNTCTEIVREVVLHPMMSSFRAMERIATTKLQLPPPPAIDWTDAQNRLHNLLNVWLDRGSKAYEAQRRISARIAGSSSIPDRIWCVVVGYAVAIFMVTAIAVAGEANLGRLSTGVADQLQQNSKFLKLALFMVLEMVMFPIITGGSIHFSLIPVFADVTVERRVQQLRESPFGSVFVCWVLGTSFMYGFSSFLSYIRSTLRPGAIYFIRDPADQSYSPVKDILERPTFSQLRKLSVSVVIYCFVIFTLFGASLRIVRDYSPVTILPLRLDSGPFTSVPFDLLFLHLVVPPTMTAMRPKNKAKQVWSFYWKLTTRAFALSHLMFGPEDVSSRIEKKNGGFRALEAVWPAFDVFFRCIFGAYDSAATEARVPATDRVALLNQKERQKDGVFVPLDEFGAPRTEKGKMALLKQDRKARQGKRDPRSDYQVIWLPRYWRTRVHVFVFSTLAMASTLLAVGFFAPLIVGRAALGMVAPDGAHDGYSYVAGAYICLLAAGLGRSVGQKISRSAFAARRRRSDSSTRFKRGVVACLSGIYASFVLYIILPLLVGVLFELYVAMPARYGVRRDTPVLHVWDAWANGMILTSIFVAVLGSGARRRLLQGHPVGVTIATVREVLKAPFATGFKKLNEVMARALPVLILGCTLPSLFLALAWSRFSHSDILYHRLIFRWSHPIVLIASLLYVFRAPLRHRYGVVRQRMIDAEYVVEERVENYGEDTDSDSDTTIKAIATVKGANGTGIQQVALPDDDEDQWVDEGEAEEVE